MLRLKVSLALLFPAYLGQVAELVGIQQKLLQTPAVSVNLVGHIKQGTVAFIDHLDVTVAPPQGYTVKHHEVMAKRKTLWKKIPRSRVINKQEGMQQIASPVVLSN